MYSIARLRFLFELGKFKIVELWLGFFVGVSLLGSIAIESPRAIITLTLILGVGIAVIGATCSLDDVVGMRDGVDQATHRGNTRWGVSKPLLTGHLKEKQAMRFVSLLGVFSILAYIGAIAAAWPLPGWAIGIITGMILVSLNYSYGLKLSYHGMGEAVIFIGGAGTVLVPYILVAKEVSPTLLFEAILVGIWHAQVVVFSNTNDAFGDRQTGRMTIAARTSKRGNKFYIGTLFILFWAVTIVALLWEWIPARILFAILPVWFLQIHQLWSGLAKEEWLRARLMGFRVLRLGIVALTAVNISNVIIPW